MDQPSNPTKAESQDFPFVGIGASAGGLEAVTELLSRLPAECGFALLIVQHLDPSRPSLLSHILSRHTSMDVEAAADQTLIAVNHVYVIPPNTSMSVWQGRLVLRPRNEAIGPPMPIDDLLESLGKDQGANAIGVILSGSGTDGAIGLQAIKACGGITFAQDEASARFGSMPRAAIGLGCVDLVLPPAGIAQELTRIASHPMHGCHVLRGNDHVHDQSNEDAMRRLFRELRAACSIDFSHYKRGTVERRLSRRLALHAVDNVTDYLKVLTTDPGEAQALCRDLLIRYTEFFRDPEAFDALTDTVLPRLVQHADAATALRIWVPGCATGEEVYSIGICVMEYLARRSLNIPVQIFGTDISDEALETARTGRYIENIARSVSPDRLSRFFIRDGDHYRVVKALRDCCTFARQNVAYDAPFSRIDLVSCRNLLIYLDPTLQRRVMPAFHFALQRDGVLMLGLSESVGAYSELFSVIESKRAKLFGKKPTSNRTYVGMNVPTLPTTIAMPITAARQATEPSGAEGRDGLRRDVERATLERFSPPSVLCDDAFNVVEFRGDTGTFLNNPPGAPTSQLQRLARPDVFLAISEAMRQVRSSGVSVRKSGLQVDVSGQSRQLAIDIVPVIPTTGEGRWYLVFFTVMDEATADLGGTSNVSLVNALKRALVASVAGSARRRGDDAKDKEIERLSAELRNLREQVRVMLEDHEAAIEELKALEEEAQSSNEEFQSTNEELETAKEELQSLNEELSTANDELRFRNRELKVLHDNVTQGRDYADAIIETMSQPLVILEGSDARVIRANQAFFERFATSPRETLQVSLYSLGNGQWNIPALRELLEELLPHRTQIRDHEITADFPDIGVRTMMLNAARLSWPEHALIVLTIDDVTYSHDLVSKLKATDRQKDEFLAMLAHELRNPLAATTNAMHLLKHEKAGDETKRAALATMERQLRNQVRMVDDLLDISRITRGLVALRIEPLDLAQIVRQAHDALREHIAAREHAVTLSLPLTPLPVDGDAARMEQVVTNLLSNSIKYTPHGGRIELSLERESDEAVLSVVDNGIGMTEAFLGRVFDVFVQAERSTDRNIGGLGIGLSVVRRLVELQGGTIEAHSEGLQRGSRFVVRLPALSPETVVPKPAAAGESVTDDVIGRLKPRRILVVDDYADVGYSALALLTLQGHEVRHARDGPAALRTAQEFRPDAILLDIGLPGMNGYEVARQLRRQPEQEQVLIIAVSGFGQTGDVAKARDAGIDHYIAKPADPEEVTELLRRA